ncbi:hypothetical protein TSUD_304400 [Trifolium subterraneum]|uniref:Uncharacterized protein n=1 Tax=Trifolium subterraneum TaxID=3900 RepID=A0A2Z6MK80_TRISU|nr:hypothetical protein TSUD_304400 [Trifolium subterraneum]
MLVTMFSCGVDMKRRILRHNHRETNGESWMERPMRELDGERLTDRVGWRETTDGDRRLMERDGWRELDGERRLMERDGWKETDGDKYLTLP